MKKKQLKREYSNHYGHEFFRKEYVAPVLEVAFIEMEQGIAAGSASVSPLSTSGNTNAVQTNWGGNDDTEIFTPY